MAKPVSEVPLEVQKLKLNEEKLDKLVSDLMEDFNDVCEGRSSEVEKWKLWYKQAHSRRPRSDNPSSRDSQIDMPLTRQRMIGLASRLKNAIRQQERVYSTAPKVTEISIDNYAAGIEQFLDNQMDQFKIDPFIDGVIEERCTFPLAIVKTDFTSVKRKIIQWEEISPEDFVQVDPMTGEVIELPTPEGVLKRKVDGMERWFVKVEGYTTEREGCWPEIVPCEDFFYADNALSVEDAEWVCHRSWPSRADIAESVRRGVYNKKYKGDDILDVLGDGNKKPDRIRGIMDGAHEDNGPGHQFEVLEFYALRDLGDGEPVEIIVTIERDSGVVLRAVYNWFHEYPRPFVTTCYMPVVGQLAGLPMTYVLEPLHAAYSASINQRLDAASRALERLLLLPDDLVRVFDKNRLHGGVYGNRGYKREDIIDLSVSDTYTQMPQIEQLIQAEADNVTGMNDYMRGNEMIDRPTATGQTSLIEEAKQPLYSQLEDFRAFMSRVALHMLARWKQYYPEGVEVYGTNEQGQVERNMLQWLPGAISEQLFVEVSVTSAQMSKQVRKQEINAMLDKIGMVYQQLAGLVQAAMQPGSPVAMPMVKLLNGYMLVFRRMLEEFDLVGKEQVAPDLVQEVQVAQQIQQAMVQMQQQMQQMAAQNQQLQGELAQLSGGPPMAGPAGPQPGNPGPPGGPPPQPGPPQPPPVG